MTELSKPEDVGPVEQVKNTSSGSESQKDVKDSEAILNAVDGLDRAVRSRQIAEILTLAAAIGGVLLIVIAHVSWPIWVSGGAIGLLLLTRAVRRHGFAARARTRIDLERVFVRTHESGRGLAHELEPDARFWSGVTLVRAARAADIRPSKSRNVAADVRPRLRARMADFSHRLTVPPSGPHSALSALWVVALGTTAGQANTLRWGLGASVPPGSTTILAGVCVALLVAAAAINLSRDRSRPKQIATFADTATDWLMVRLQDARDAQPTTGYALTEVYREPPITE